MPNSMLKIRRIVFWEPSLSPHKIDLIHAIKQVNPNIDILYLSARGMSESRKKLGWTEQGFDECIVNPSLDFIAKVLSEDISTTFHIFSGLKGGVMFEHALPLVKKNKVQFILLSEPRANEGFKGFLRYLHSWCSEIWIREQVSYVFAIGVNGPKWFSSVGYQQDKIKPFAYFISTQNYDDLPVKNIDDCVIGFVGRLVKEKGFYDVVASSKLVTQSQFKIIGAGKGHDYMLSHKNSYPNIQYLGAVDIIDIPNQIASLDILVLPSHTTDDGWGMVISEALMAGCYVITTNKVGASLLLFCPEIGAVVDVENPQHIAQAIQNAQLQGFLTVEMKQRRKEWALRNLSAVNAAQFLVNTLRGESKSPLFFDKHF